MRLPVVRAAAIDTSNSVLLVLVADDDLITLPSIFCFEGRVRTEASGHVGR